MLSSWLLVDVWRRQPEERLRSWGLFLYLNAFAVMALGIAWARPRTIIDRYPILIAPFLCGMYFIWLIYGRDRRGEQVCAVLCALVLVFTPIRTYEGWRWASERFEKTQVFREELRAGMPLSALVERHTTTIHPNPRSMRMMLRFLHEAQIGDFRYLNVDEDESVNTPSRKSKPMRGE